MDFILNKRNKKRKKIKETKRAVIKEGMNEMEP